MSNLKDCNSKDFLSNNAENLKSSTFDVKGDTISLSTADVANVIDLSSDPFNFKPLPFADNVIRLKNPQKKTIVSAIGKRVCYKETDISLSSSALSGKN